MEKRLFNRLIKQQLLSAGFEKTGPNDYTIHAKDGKTKLIVRVPDQTLGFLIGVQFSDYGKYTGKFTEAVMRNFECKEYLSFAKSNDYSENEIQEATNAVLASIVPYIERGKDCIRENVEEWVFGVFSDRERNEILAYLGLPTIDPYSKEYMQEVIKRTAPGMITMPFEEYFSHEEFYEQYASVYGGKITLDEKDRRVMISFSSVKIFCKVITVDCTEATEAQVKAFAAETLEHLGVMDIVFNRFAPYWKNAAQGEMSFHFSTLWSLAKVQSLFADTWQSDVADMQWSNIHCPGVAFLWISQ